MLYWDRENSIEDSFSSDSNSQSKKSLEICVYCMVDNPYPIVHCESCSTWYCPDPLDYGSHFSLHLSITNHKVWSSYEQGFYDLVLLECFDCLNNDITELVIVHKNMIACRSCTIRLKNSDNTLAIIELISNGQPSPIIFGVRSPEQLIKRKKMSKMEIIEYENNIKNDFSEASFDQFYRDVKIKKTYTTENEYQIILTIMLMNEMNAKKKLVTEFIIRDVNIFMKKGVYEFFYSHLDDRFKLSVGMNVVITDLCDKEKNAFNGVIVSLNTIKRKAKLRIIWKKIFISKKKNII